MLPKKYKVLKPELIQELQTIGKRYERPQAALLPVLHRLQQELGWISRECEADVANFLEVPEVKVREVISFYHMFQTKPIGKHHIRVCQTLSCHLMGSNSALAHLKQKLGIGLGETTEDGKFKLETVECLGACEIAPMMQINEATHGPLTNEKIDKILNEL